MKNTKRWTQAKYLAQQEPTFTVISPKDWDEDYIPKSSWPLAIGAVLTAALVIAGCAVLFDLAQIFPN